MVATIQSGAEAITKRGRGTLVFVKHEGSWKIVHELFLGSEMKTTALKRLKTNA